MNRVNNPSKYLVNVVNTGQQYYIGFGISELTDIAKKNLGVQELLTSKKNSVVVTGRSGVLKENTTGKFVRKQPFSKTSVWRHIDYYSTRFEKQISFDREFHVWEKELLHRFNLELSLSITPQGERVLHFPMFIMDNSDRHFLKAGVAMNIAIQFGKYFMLYDTELQPIIPVTKVKDKSILPPGAYGSVAEKLDVISQNLNHENEPKDLKGNSYRFALLKEFEPDEVTMGRGGFNDYLMFEYKNYNLIVLENLKSGNATYTFNLSKFDRDKTLDKQTARKDPSFTDRIIHENMEDWNSKMRTSFRLLN